MQPSGVPIIIAAPSGAGKTSLVNALVKELPNLKISISHTTRSKRLGEIDGVNYHFISEAEFNRKIAENEFLEYATVFKNYYGTSKQWLETALAAGDDIILEIDWQGAAQVRKFFKTAVSIFIFPPSLAILEQRLRQRAQDDETTIAARMEEARSEMSHYHEFDYLIINEDFQTALEELKAIIQAERQSRTRMQQQFKRILEG